MFNIAGHGFLTIFGDTRECLGAVADKSLSGGRFARELGRLIVLRGKPVTIVSDNGTELTGNAIPEAGQSQPIVPLAPIRIAMVAAETQLTCSLQNPKSSRRFSLNQPGWLQQSAPARLLVI